MTGAGAFGRSALRELEFLRRHPWELAAATWFPLLLVAVLAWLLSAGAVRSVPLAVVDHDNTPLSREFVRLLDAAPALDIAARPAELEQAWSLARERRVYAVVYIPRDTERELERGRSATLFAYFNASFRIAGNTALADIAAATQALRGRVDPRAAPVRVQSTVLFNSVASYEHYLVSLLHPAVLHLALCLCVIAAFGRELRDRSAAQWLDAAGGSFAGAVAGKAAPYVAAFTLYSAASTAWLAARGGGVAGSLAALTAAQFLMYLAYAGIGLLLVGLTRSMGQALSLAGIYAGTSLAFADGTFALDGGLLFARVWNALLPYAAYVHIQRQQLDIGAPWLDSARWFAALAAFIIVAGGGGLALYARAARDPAAWGRR